MQFPELLQLLFSGLALGMIYALIAFGYNITFSTSRTLNFSQGDFLMLGAFVSYSIIGAMVAGKRALPGWHVFFLCLLGAAVLGALLAIILQQVAIKPALKTGSDVSWILATISLGIIAKNVAERLWTTDDVPVRSPLGSNAWQFMDGKLSIDPREFMIIIAAAVIMTAFEIFRRKSMLGKAVTAVASDKDAASLMGINVPVVITFSFMVSCAIAAMGGVLVAPLTFASASMGTLLGVKAYAASVIGGLQSGLGVVVGGLILGMSEQLTARFVSTGYKDTPGFILLIIILLVKPDGLFGKASVKKV